MVPPVTTKYLAEALVKANLCAFLLGHQEAMICLPLLYVKKCIGRAK